MAILRRNLNRQGGAGFFVLRPARRIARAAQFLGLGERRGDVDMAGILPGILPGTLAGCLVIVLPRCRSVLAHLEKAAAHRGL